MSLPDYEGKDYYESDRDESEISPEHTPKNSDAKAHMTFSTDERIEQEDVHDVPQEQLASDEQADVQSQEWRSEHDGKAQHVTPEKTSGDAETGVTSEPLEGYRYTSQSDTPRIPPVELTAQETLRETEESAIHPKASDTSPENTSTVTNIRGTDHNPLPVDRSIGVGPPVSSHSKSASRGTNYTTEDEDPSFAAEVLKSLEAAERSLMANPAPETPKMATEQPPPSKSPTAPGTDAYASSNYWAHMRATLKEKRSIGQDMSRTSSHKTGDSTEEIVHKTSSPAPRSSNESSRPVKPASDGRSGSFTSYTPIPKFSDQHRPSSPGAGVPYGLPAYPSIDTTGARKPFSGSTGEFTRPRGTSASEEKRAQIGYIPSGNRSASNSPITGSLPFSVQNPSGPGSRPSGNRDEEITGELPVFAPKEGLPDTLGVEERIGRQQNPAWGGPTSQQARSQSPGYGISPARVLPLSQGMDKTSRTPSPLEDIPEENKEIEAPTAARARSPLKRVPVATATPVNIPSQTEPMPKSFAHVVAPPPPIAHTRTPEPISPQPENRAALPVISPINIPPLAQIGIDRSSPSPDEEWKDDDNEDPEAIPTDKRTTVFLQEAGKQKEAQGLPPLPTEAPLPASQSFTPAEIIPEERLEDVVERTHGGWAPQRAEEVLEEPIDDPVERLKKHFQTEVPVPLNPPPAIPVLERQLPASEMESDFNIQDESPAQIEAVEPVVEPSAKSTHAASASIPSIYRPETPTYNPPVADLESPSKGRSKVTRPLVHQLPELDILRPMTWGSLVIENPPQVPPELPTLTKDPETMHDKAAKDVSINDELMYDEPLKDTEVVDDEVDVQPPKDKEVMDDEVDIGSSKDMEVMDDEVNVREVKDKVVENKGLKEDESESDWEKVEKEDVEEGPSVQQVEAIKEPKHNSTALENLTEPLTSIDEIMAPHVPPESEPEAEELPPRRLDKGKEKEVYVDDAQDALSSDNNTDHDSIVGSKFFDRDITSFIVPRTRPNPGQEPMPPLPSLRTQPNRTSSGNQISLAFLPPFMMSRDISELSTVEQRVGTYQSRREQMLKADTGLRGWLVQVQQNRSPDIPQLPPEVQRLSRESFGTPAPPMSATAFTGSGKVGKKMISKIRIGGKKLGITTKHTIDKMGPSGEKRSSVDVNYTQQFGEISREDTASHLRYSRETEATLDSPIMPRSGGPLQTEFKQASQELEPGRPGPYALRDQRFSNEGPSESLGVTTPGVQSPQSPVFYSQVRTSGQAPLSPASFASLGRYEERPRTPQSPGGFMSKKDGKQGGRNALSATISGAKVPKLFGGSSDSKPKHRSDDYPSLPSPQLQQSTSPKPKFKLSKFVSELSQATLTVSKPAQALRSQSPIPVSPPPPPIDKSQSRTAPEGSGRFKGFFNDLGSRDITGKKPSERQTFPPGSTASPRVAEERPGTSGFGKFFSDLNKRDLTGRTEEERIAETKRREQETTRIPAQPVEYDERASDWEVKLAVIEDVLPHIGKDILVESLKQAGGDEHKAIGLAVVKSR